MNTMTGSELISEDYLREQQRLHENPRYGVASIGYAPLIADLLRIQRLTSLADYGAGKRNLQRRLSELGLNDFEYLAYDPAFSEYGRPRPADLVACIDVLEHIEPEHLDAVLDELASITRRLGFFTIHTGPAVKTLSDGRNAHLIQQPPAWWLARLSERFDVIHLQDVPKGFWVLVAPCGEADDALGETDRRKLIETLASGQPRPKTFLAKIAKKLGLRF